MASAGMSMELAEVEQEDDAEREERSAEVLVEELQNMGINVADIKKLREASLTTVSSILMTTRKDLLNIKGFSEAKVQKLLDSGTCPRPVQFRTIIAMIQLPNWYPRLEDSKPHRNVSSNGATSGGSRLGA